MVQDESGGNNYHVWNEEYWPGEGYIYNYNKTNCDDEFLHWNEETENISLDNNKSDKCTTIDFEAKWLSFKNWSRIMDFGNGQYNDNIFVANQGTSSNLNIDSRYGTEATRGSTTASAAITLNQKTHYRIEVIKNETSYTHNIYKDDALILTKTYNVTSYVRNTNRTENFLGKSNWTADAYFHGFIYNLKITDASGKPILWYKFDK